jgi:2-oxoglutarate dehydrogenase E2 component (dihydrolipoamide succinyltransferase)
MVTMVKKRYMSGEPEKAIEVPNMGDSITEGTLKAWLKAEGEFAAADEIIAEIETDKIVVHIR